MNRGFTVVPNNVKCNTDLKYLSRFILGDVISYTSTGLCFVSNEHLAIMYGVKERTIETCIKELIDKGYIVSNYRRKVHKRFLYPTQKAMPNYEELPKEVQNEQEEEYLEEERKKEEKKNNKSKVVKIKDLKKIWT